MTNNKQDYQLTYGNLVDFEAIGFYYVYTNEETVPYKERAQTQPLLLALEASSLPMATLALIL